MKKQNVIAAVGTIAILANLLVPGLAFGATDSQQATQYIGCPTGTQQEFSFTVPAGVTFDTKTASGNSQVAFDHAVGTMPASELAPLANMLVVTDTRSGGAEGCPDSTQGLKGFNVAAVITSPANGGVGLTSDVPVAGSYIMGTQFRVVTTAETVSTPSGMLSDTAGVWYSHEGSTAGNLRNVTADYTKATASDLRDIATYTGTFGGRNTLDLSRDLLTTTTSHDGKIGTAVVISSQIPGNQNPGTYVGTVTYTLAQNS
jgi:hypothetical protein